MPTLSATPIVNAAIADAKSLPGLIANLQAADPSLATQLESKPLLASKSPPAVLIAYGIAWASTRYGFGWDETTCSLVAGVIVTLAAYGMRYVTKQPTAGIVSTPPGIPPAVPVVAPSPAVEAAVDGAKVG